MAPARSPFAVVPSASAPGPWQPILGGLTAPQGFLAAGITAGLKPSGNPDLSLLLAPEDAVCAGSFTTSLVRAACVDLCAERLAQGCGIELVRTVKQRHQTVRALLLVGGSRPQATTRRALEAGCDAILREEELARGTGCDALRAVSVGGIYIDRGLNGGGDQSSGSPGAIPCLSERERQVLTLVASGERNSSIALKLFLSIETVKTHLRHGMDKLQARDRAHAAVLAMQLGLIDTPPAVRHR